MKGLGQRFIYFPWHKKAGGVSERNLQYWNDNYNERYLADKIAEAGGEFYYEGPQAFYFTRFHLVADEDPVPTSFVNDVKTHIYVWGHGAAGLTTIAPYSSFESCQIEADDVAKRLIKKFVLDGTFVGRIKLYICESGLAPTGSMSFGEMFAREFHNTCPKAKVFAYKACVSMGHVIEEEHPGTLLATRHKEATNRQGKRLGTAKALRFEIPPHTAI